MKIKEFNEESLTIENNDGQNFIICFDCGNISVFDIDRERNLL